MKIFYDVDTQNDFMNKSGSLYVPDAELIKPKLYALTNYARRNNIPIVGSVDRHFGTEEYKERELELARWGGPFPDHCMANTSGELKIKETTFWYPSSAMATPLETDRTNDLGRYIPHKTTASLENKKEFLETFLFATRLDYLTKSLRNKEQNKSFDPVYFEKQSYDIFTNPAFEVFLKFAGVKEAVVYGVATDFCVRAAVLGMQARKISCYVVEDAIKGVFPDKSKEALEEMARAGAKFVQTKQILDRRLG